MPKHIRPWGIVATVSGAVTLVSGALSLASGIIVIVKATHLKHH